MIFLYICKIPRRSSSIFRDGSGRTGKQERWPIISYQTLERFELSAEILFSGCCLDNGSQPWDHLGGGEEAEEEVDP